MKKKIIFQCGIDGTEAISCVPNDYQGRVALSYKSLWSEKIRWAEFPNLEQGEMAAAMAARHDIGGYVDVVLHPANLAPAGTFLYDSAADCFL